MFVRLSLPPSRPAELIERSRLGSGFIDPSSLVPASEDEIPHIDRSGAALLLDGALRRLMVARGALERQIGRRLVRLRERDGFFKLGFARLADYLAERTEMSLRSGQEMMRTAAGLEALPLTRAASDAGRISASHVRLLVGRVTPQAEAAWLARAERLTVRALRQALAEARSAGDDGVAAGAAEADAADDAARSARVSFPAPASFRARWDAAVDLFRKLEGRDDVPVGEAAGAFVAEWRAGLDDAALAEERSASQEGGGGAAREAGRDGRLATPARELASLARQLEELTGCWAFLEDAARDVKLPGWLGAADGSLPDDPHAADAEIVDLARVRRTLDAMTARILFTLSRVGLVRAMLFSSLEHYARERAGLSPRKARELAFIERRLWQLPLTREAFARGTIGMAKLRLLVRVMPTANEPAWLERAASVTVRRLEDEVRWYEEQERLRRDGVLERPAAWSDVVSPPPPPEGTSLRRHTSAPGEDVAPAAPATDTVSFALEADALEEWRASLALCRGLAGRPLAEWECAERFVAAFASEWDRRDPRASVLAHKAIDRDGWRCTVPGCRARSKLHAHHIVWRSRGGSDDLGNLLTVCSLHHDAIHRGFVAVRGQAPAGLEWQLGTRSAAGPLLRVGPGERLELDGVGGARLLPGLTDRRSEQLAPGARPGSSLREASSPWQKYGRG